MIWLMPCVTETTIYYKFYTPGCIKVINTNLAHLVCIPAKLVCSTYHISYEVTCMVRSSIKRPHKRLKNRDKQF